MARWVPLESAKAHGLRSYALARAERMADAMPGGRWFVDRFDRLSDGEPFGCKGSFFPRGLRELHGLESDRGYLLFADDSIEESPIHRGGER